MAISRGAGTEIIRTIHFDYDAGNTTDVQLIIGVQHHIYTVLSIICYADQTTSNSNDGLTLKLQAFDSSVATANTTIKIFETGATYGEKTFVWNDKFSFNGYDATGISTAMNSNTDQDALADQGGGNAQQLLMAKGHANDAWMVTCTYIDQNNA